METNHPNAKNFVFLDAEAQTALNSRFVDSLPWNSLGRKNVGYFYAIASGAKVIWDFHEDNMIKFWMPGAADPEWNLDIDVAADTILRGTVYT